MNIALTDAVCRVKQALAVLGIWLEVQRDDNETACLIASLQTLLEGVPETIGQAENELNEFPASQVPEGKS
ncbi:hypothetical protein PIH19_001153 [Escherichia coli]|nr:hypothetical protein [Escherichia coli]MCX1267089.1 hypothetical protein [Escherichia coli]MED8182858.1 hypothetical protein [Escherichia coli]